MTRGSRWRYTFASSDMCDTARLLAYIHYNGHATGDLECISNEVSLLHALRNNQTVVAKSRAFRALCRHECKECKPGSTRITFY